MNRKQEKNPIQKFLKFLLLGCTILLILCLLLIVSHRCLYLSSAYTPSAEQTDSLVVLTYNTHQLGQYKKPHDNQVIQYLRTQSADIICLQEVDVYKNNKYLTLTELKSCFSHYPYSYFDFKVHNSHRQYGNVIFSKYPLINKHTVRYDSRANISSCCDVVLPCDTIRLITNHLESNRIEHKDIDSLVENRTISHTTLSNKISHSAQIRRRQAKAVHEECLLSPHPVLLVGDCNTIPISLTYFSLRRGMRDAFLCTSNGRLGNTYTYPIFSHLKGDSWIKHLLKQLHIGARIDYVLCSPTMTPLSLRIDTIQASDHYPVITTFALPIQTHSKP